MSTHALVCMQACVCVYVHVCVLHGWDIYTLMGVHTYTSKAFQMNGQLDVVKETRTLSQCGHLQLCI